jgi:transcriptional regulator with XRE-family HTH domain
VAAVDEEDRIGRRIAAARKVTKLTQRRLAAAAGVSPSLVQKVEAGHAPATPSFVGAVARALGVDAGYLTGQPYTTGPADLTEIHQRIPTIRRVLATLDLLPVDDQVEARSIEELRRTVAALSQLRRDTAYAPLAEMLPTALAELAQAAHWYEGQQQVYSLLTIGLRGVNSIAHKLGYHDLSLSALDHMQASARQSHDPLLIAITQYLRAQGLARIGAGPEAYELVTTVMAGLEPMLADGDPTAHAVYGALHMQAGLLQALAADEQRAREHLAEAERLAEQTGSDRLVYETSWGPTNVRLHMLSAELALLQPRRAVNVAESICLPGDLPRERASYYHIDAAQAYLTNGQPDRALDMLYEARALAPLYVRNSVAVRDTVYALAEKQRRSRPGLREFATSIGIKD